MNNPLLSFDLVVFAFKANKKILIIQGFKENMINFKSNMSLYI